MLLLILIIVDGTQYIIVPEVNWLYGIIMKLLMMKNGQMIMQQEQDIQNIKQGLL